MVELRLRNVGGCNNVNTSPYDFRCAEPWAGYSSPSSTVAGERLEPSSGIGETIKYGRARLVDHLHPPPHYAIPTGTTSAPRPVRRLRYVLGIGLKRGVALSKTLQVLLLNQIRPISVYHVYGTRELPFVVPYNLDQHLRH